MPTLQTKSGFVNSGNARLYYEMAGQGVPFVMIHAGVADNRQWNNEFAFFAQNYQVVRYDMRLSLLLLTILIGVATGDDI